VDFRQLVISGPTTFGLEIVHRIITIIVFQTYVLVSTGWRQPFVRHRRGKRSQHIRVGLAEERKGSQDHGDQGQSNL